MPLLCNTRKNGVLTSMRLLCYGDTCKEKTNHENDTHRRKASRCVQLTEGGGGDGEVTVTDQGHRGCRPRDVVCVCRLLYDLQPCCININNHEVEALSSAGMNEKLYINNIWNDNVLSSRPDRARAHD